MAAGGKRGQILCSLLLLCLAGCASREPPPREERIAVPPALAGTLRGALPPSLERAVLVPLRPYDRARDLEVLLLSSGSTVYAGMVVPGRALGTFSPWIEAVEARGWAAGVRPDVVASLKVPGGLAGVPLTLDGAVMVYRADWWRTLGLPPPATMAALREGLLAVRSWHPQADRPVRSALPADELFWDLAMSYGRDEAPGVYSFPTVHALTFLREFGLSPSSPGSRGGMKALEEGRAAVLFTRASDLAGPGAWTDRPNLAVARLPAGGARARVIFAGWCLVKPRAGEADTRRWKSLVSPAVQEALSRKGFLTVLAGGGNPGFTKVLAGTRFCSPPDLGVAGDEIVDGAIRDATEASLTAEEALRRAEARLRGAGGAAK